MLFKPELCQAILEGRKTQTRRLVKPGDSGRGYRWVNGRWLEITSVYSGTDRLKWRAGPHWSYAVQPGRGKKAVGRIQITAIRQERLQDISCGGYIHRSDVQQEGCPFVNDPKQMGLDEIEWFIGLWDSIHTEKGTRWQGNPEVWVLEFEVVSTPKER